MKQVNSGQFTTRIMSKSKIMRTLFVGAAIAAMFALPAGVARAATLIWDANGTGDGQTDGDGAWLDTGQWWDGSANVGWTSGNDAVFGNGGDGGAVTLASPTTVNSLTLNSFTGAYTLGTGDQAITLSAGLTMNLGAGAATIISPVTLGAAQSWTNNSTGLLTVGTDAVDNGGYLLTVGGTGNTTIAGAIGGAGGLTKSGSGTLVLSGNNTYTGPTTVSAGTLQLSHADAVSSSSASSGLALKGGKLVLDTAVNMTNLTLSGVGNTVSGAGTMAFASGGSILFDDSSGSRTATISSGITGSPTYTETAGEHLTLDPGATATQTLGDVSLQPRVHGTVDLSFTLQGSTAGNSTGSITLTTSDNGQRGNLNKRGSGTWTVDALQGAYNMRLVVNLYDTGRLIVKGDIYGIDLNFQSATATLELQKAGDLFTVPPAGGSNKISKLQGTIDNTSGGLITFAGGARIASFAGDFTLSGDSVNFGTAAVILATTPQVTVQNPAATMTLGGVVQKDYGLIKAGEGTLELRRDNTYTGPTVVNQGTLLVNNPTGSTGSGTGTGSVTVNSGGTLGGDGTIAGAVTVAGGAVLWDFDGTAGNTLDLQNNLELDSGWKLTLTGTGTPGGDYDLFTYTGSFSGSLAAIVNNSAVPGWPPVKINQDTTPGAGRIYLTFETPGDTNSDGVVDAADYITLKKNFGAGLGGDATVGNFDGIGTVNWADLNILTSNIGPGSGAPATAPEPATLFVLMAAGLPALLKRRRRRS